MCRNTTLRSLKSIFCSSPSTAATLTPTCPRTGQQMELSAKFTQIGDTFGAGPLSRRICARDKLNASHAIVSAKASSKPRSKTFAAAAAIDLIRANVRPRCRSKCRSDLCLTTLTLLITCCVVVGAELMLPMLRVLCVHFIRSNRQAVASLAPRNWRR